MPTASTVSISKIEGPPRFAGNDRQVRQALERYLAQYYQSTQAILSSLVGEHNKLVADVAAVEARLNAISATTPLDITISASYSQSEVQSVADQVDALIEAAS